MNNIFGGKRVDLGQRFSLYSVYDLSQNLDNMKLKSIISQWCKNTSLRI